MEYMERSKYMTHNVAYKHNHSNRNIILKKLIFPPISEDKIDQLTIDDESIKLITFTSSAQDTTNVIMNNLFDFPCPNIRYNTTKWKELPLYKKMKSLVITEMTAGVGGNVLNFAKYFKYVNAIEINTLRYNYLNRNIKLYGYHNVNCYNDDSLDLLTCKDDILQDIVFFDPPWGGKDYKLATNLRLTFGQYSIENVCKMLFQRSCNKIIVIKLPNNYDFDFLCQELADYRVGKFVLNWMTIVVAKNYADGSDETN